MKVLICGLPPNKLHEVETMLHDANLHVICAGEGTKAWQRKVKPADLCVVITNLIAHHNMIRVKQVFGRSYVPVQTYNEAM